MFFVIVVFRIFLQYIRGQQNITVMLPYSKTKSQSLLGAGRYAYLLFDSTFKVVLCTPANESLLIDIFELLIPGKHIQSITFLNKEMHGLVISEKNVNFDMLCKDKDTGEEFLVEVQNREQDSFKDRMLVYSTYPIREQMEIRAQEIHEGKREAMDYSLNPVYVISMVDFPISHESEDAIENNYISRYELRNLPNGELMTPALNFIFLELDRLKLGVKDAAKCRNLLERFVFSMKYMHEFTEVPQSFDDPLLDKLYHATELATMTVTERQNYDSIMWTEIDRMATEAFARKQGKAEGKAEGEAEGAQKERKKNIKALLSNGVSAQVIAESLELSVEEVMAIAAQ